MSATTHPQASIAHEKKLNQFKLPVVLLTKTTTILLICPFIYLNNLSGIQNQTVTISVKFCTAISEPVFDHLSTKEIKKRLTNHKNYQVKKNIATS